MATVYLARLSGVGGFQRFVAIKRLHPHLANDSEFIQMFLDEARLAARLHHPNVVPILEIGQSPEGYYLVMEYIEGDTLARILARSAQSGKFLPHKVALRVCLDALAGLHTAHELTDDDGMALAIVHRDVSPQNILVGVDGTARITDFGVARAATRLSTTRTGQLKGKLAYMAPEQARGKAVDRRADVFAMGIVTWESLAHKRLFKGEGEADTLNRVLYEPIPRLRQANPNVSVALEEVVMKALEREPDARWPTAADFADALERTARTEGILGAPRDIKEHLNAVLGTDISQQREAVRAWLARSEPSQHGNFGLPPPSTPSTTKVEGQRDGRSGVSSVSSAVIAVPGSAPSISSATAPAAEIVVPERKRSRVWVGVAVALVAAAIAVPLALMRFRAPPAAAGATPPAQSAAVVPQEPVDTAPAATTAAPTPTETAKAPESGSASATAKDTTAKPKATTHHVWRPPHGGSHVKPPPTATAAPAHTATAAPTTTAKPAGTVDDISKNPYR